MVLSLLLLAEAIVKAVKDAGGAFTDEGKEIIQGFADMNQQVTDSREELSEIMLKMNGEVETELENVKNNFGEEFDSDVFNYCNLLFR